MPLRVLIAPDKFKGSLTALEAAETMAAGVRDVFPDAQTDLCPIADGGEGFMEALRPALGGEWVTTPAVDALGRPIESRYLLAETEGERIAVLEMAATAGIAQLADEDRDPLHATTRGVGMQVIDAVDNHQATHVFLGLGGSATNDGGCGLAAALGVEFLDISGQAIDPLPVHLHQVTRVDTLNRRQLPPIIAACDVDNPLLGPRGATSVFSAQKGASANDQLRLEAALTWLVQITNTQDAAERRGAGAAGGLGFGLLNFADACLAPGFDLLADLLDFDQRIGQADLVLTGEGSLDAQSLGGKGPVALARQAQTHQVEVLAFSGTVDDAARNSGLFAGIHTLDETGLPLDTLMREADRLLRKVVRTALKPPA